jgi:hypothetical protein
MPISTTNELPVSAIIISDILAASLLQKPTASATHVAHR